MIQVSVIVPMFNEREHIGACLEALLDQTLDREQYEIIVVDNGSTDDSVSIVKNKGISPIVLPNKNVGAVRNQGAKDAIGELLVFIDGDCVAPKNWLENLLSLHKKTTKNVFGGGALLPDNVNWIERDWLLEGAKGPSLPKELIGAAIACPRDIFVLANGFDESVTSGEDTEFSKKLRAMNIEVRILSDISVIHLGNAKTLSQFFFRQAWHGENYFRKIIKSLTDMIFWLTIAYGISVLGLFTSILININQPILITSTITIPAILTVKRIYRAKLVEKNICRLLLIHLLDHLYLLGRLFGALMSITHTKKN